MRLSRKTVLALEAVLDVAFNARPDPVQAKEITRRQGVPQRYLEQVMQHLVHEGILKGVRGPRGGYRLARERRRISVGEVVRIVSALEAAEDASPNGGSDLGEKVVRPLLEEVTGEVMTRLDAISIEDLCRRAESEGIGWNSRESMDFTI